jgi:hypothetical protein
VVSFLNGVWEHSTRVTFGRHPSQNKDLLNMFPRYPADVAVEILFQGLSSAVHHEVCKGGHNWGDLSTVSQSQ